jgi:hypothetical protein
MIDTLGGSFSIEEGNQINWFLRNGDAAAHVIVTNEKNPRLLISFPAENVGEALWFDRSRNPNLDLSLSAVPAVRAGGESQTVSLGLRANKSEIVLTEYALDSIRVIRSHRTEEGGRPDPAAARALREKYAASHPEVPEGWARETVRVGPGEVEVSRANLDGRIFRIHLTLPPGVQSAVEDGRVKIWRRDGEPCSFEATATVPIAPLHAYAPHDLLRPEVFATLEQLDAAARAPAASSAVVADRDAFAGALRALLFLSSREKYMAGSWRFLTYFGRDTMISLMLLHDILTPKAYSDGIQSVLDRVAPNGDVAHEEDIGPFAELRRLLDPRLAGPLTAPIYDYKMIDDDLLLPIMEAVYVNDNGLPLEERRAFVSRNQARILSNWDFVLGKAAKWHGRDYRNLVRIRPRLVVGDWRDSEVGLGRGTYPGDVNVDLMPQAIVSIRQMIASGLFEPDALRGYPNLGAALDDMREAWRRTGGRFRVTLPTQEVRTRLRAFVASAPPDQRELFEGERFSDGTTVAAFLAGSTPPELQAPLVFPALSLDDEGRPVEVMNSDFGFRLFLDQPTETELGDLLRLVELPYPVGLMTPVGPVVANPAYSRDRRLWKDLDRDAYHGAVIWSWQASLLESGLLRQRKRFVSEPALEARITRAIERLVAARRTAGPLAGSELWTWDIRRGQIVPLAFGQRESSQTESNAVQLWSTIYPALRLQELQQGLDRP